MPRREVDAHNYFFQLQIRAKIEPLPPVPSSLRLLVVEDNPAEQLSIRELLGHHDIDVSVAATGVEALNINWGADNATHPTDANGRTLSFLNSAGTEFEERVEESLPRAR